MGIKKNTGIIIFLIAIFCGCIKDDLVWDLKKVNRLATVNTITAKNISNTGSTIDSEVKYDGGSPVTQRGVCWSTTQNPTIADNVTNNGTGLGSFTSSITGLNVNTTYYCRAYATNGVGTAYGNEINFTTTNISASLPTLTTTSESGITTNSASSGGNITSDGGSAVTQRGVCWSTNPNPTIANNITNNGTGAGSFISSITGLNPNTTYYCRAYATNGVGAAYGNQISFTTSNVSTSSPTLTTSSASGITTNSASSGGDITLDGGSAVTQRGVCWSTNQNPTIANNITNNGTGTGSFSSSITGLNANTTYYCRAYATNGVGTAYGNQISFTTSNVSATLPTLTTSSASGITTNSANSGGNITTDGGSTVTQRGVCWSTNQNPTIANNVTNNGSGIGSFTSSITGLNANTTYYCRAYATNGVGTAYGNQINFTTTMPTAMLVGSNSCSSLNAVTSLYYGMNGTSDTWGISSAGYSGSCWVAPDPNNSGQLGTVVGSNHYVQFTRNFSNQGYIEFWVNTYNPGYNNLTPAIVVNGAAIGSATMVGGQTSSFYWMKVRSPIVQAGNNTIRISLSGSYYVLNVDEIEYYEY